MSDDNKKLQVIAYEDDRVRVFPSVKRAAEFYGIPNIAVYQLIKSGNPSSNGVCFDYIEE